MGYRGFLYIFLLVLGFSQCTALSAQAAEQAKPDVRVLIDISGSMKKNDPKNLRVPALQLITNLLPQNADAGVWAFGRYVNMMVPLKPVDAAWQKQATAAARKINSLGLYTNIGGVLEKASYGWREVDPGEKRSMILLTDGMVDISKDAAVNGRERKRILDQLLPRLKRAGVAIHTVALSQQADHELLRALSAQTDGWYAAVDSADELEKVFLKIFEQAAERDSLPITDNRFSVDASIDEMTVLVFKQANGKPVRLVAPDGQSYSGQQHANHIRWFSSGTYDLITISKPAVGEWQIDANVDPDNRVMVVSKLGLKVEPIPNNILAGEAISYQLQLLEDNQVISKPEFLQLVDAKLETMAGGKRSTLAMFFDSANNSFKQNFFADVNEGELQLAMRVKSPTFERVRRHAVNVYGSPVILEVEQSASTAVPHKVHFSLRSDIVRPQSLRGNLVVNYPDGEKQFIALESFDQPIELRTLEAGGEYSIEQEYSGQSVTGRQFKVTPSALVFNAVETEEYVAAKQQTKQPEPKPATEEAEPALEQPEPEPEPQPQPEPAEPEQKQPEPGWSTMTWVYVGLAFNIVVAGLGFLFWRWWKQRGMSETEALADEIEIEEEDSSPDQSGDEQNDEIEASTKENEQDN